MKEDIHLKKEQKYFHNKIGVAKVQKIQRSRVRM